MPEKYEAIVNCINEKLKEDERMLKFYREQLTERENKIVELEKENIQLSKEICEVKHENEKLKEGKIGE